MNGKGLSPAETDAVLQSGFLSIVLRDTAEAYQPRTEGAPSGLP